MARKRHTLAPRTPRSGTSIRITSGTEGPRHDPYSWTELEVTRSDGRCATLRSGLGSWLELDGGTRVEEYDAAGGFAELVAAFTAHVGIAPNEAEHYRAMLDANDPYHEMSLGYYE